MFALINARYGEEVRSISNRIHELLPMPCHERPFVCDGFPEDCTVIVIGENPATELTTDWWSFWSDHKGFDLRKFESVYETERRSKGERPVSNTRKRLNWLREHGLHCLETNAFSNEGLGGHKGGVSNAELLSAFLKGLPRLKGVIAHGKVAKECLGHQSLPSGVRSYQMRHFRSESRLNIDRVAKELLNL